MSDEERATASLGEQPRPPRVSGEPRAIAEGVWVIEDGGVPLVPNVGIVIGERSGLVVDTAMGPGNGRLIHDAAAALAGARPLVVTATHFHPEHAYGAQAFPDATLVLNRAQADELAAKGASYLEMFRGFGPEVAAELEDVVLRSPDLVFDGSATLELGGRRVELLSVGQAHTRGDQVVWLPAERVLFTGDLVESGSFAIMPFFPPEDADVDPSAWIDALGRLEELDPETVVPGHGALGGVELIAAVRGYLSALRAETGRLAGEGLGVDEITAVLDPEFRARYPSWGSAEWIAFGVRCFHAELGRAA